MTTAPPPQPDPTAIDPVAAARWQHRAALRSPWLHEEVARRMAQRLSWIRVQPAAWANWFALQGGVEGHRLVQRQYPDAAVHLIEASPGLARLACDRLRPPWWTAQRWRGPRVLASIPSPESVQLVWCNMALHHAPDPRPLLAAWHQALAPGGFLMFSCLGPDTVRGLRDVYARMGWPPPAAAFSDMHDWGDRLVAHGFAEPVMDMESIELSWSTPQALLAELRTLGRNLHPQRHPALRGRQWHARLLHALGDALADAAQAQRLVLRFEIVYGHAFKAAHRAAPAGETRIDLQTVRRQLRQRGDSGT